MNTPNKIEVEIFHKKFTLFSAEEGAEHLKRLAALVDERMKDIYAKTQLSSALKIAILTALNLAEELYIEKQTKNHQVVSEDTTELNKRVLKVVQKMETLIQDIGE